MLKGQHHEITVYAGSQGLDPIYDNVDVEVTFDDGSRYMATFFTMENLHKLMEKNAHTGECMKGLYFWASDMIIIGTLTRENIAKIVAHLISEGEFEGAFSRVTESKGD